MNNENYLKILANKEQYKEIWLEGPAGNSLCALINGDCGFLMYLDSEADDGVVSSNPSVISSESMNFKLSNGQIDVYPKSYTCPISVIKCALDSFAKNNKRPCEVDWSN